MIEKMRTYPPTSPLGKAWEKFGIEPDSGTYRFKDDNGNMIQQDRIANVYGIRSDVAVQIGSVVRRQRVTENISADGARNGFTPQGEAYFTATLLSYGPKEHKVSHFAAMNESGKLSLEALRNDLLDAVNQWAIDTGALDKPETVRSAASQPVRSAAAFGRKPEAPKGK